VGRFNNRDIDKTIAGTRLFINNNPGIDLSYTIVGDDGPGIMNNLKKTIEKFKLEPVVCLAGRIPHGKLDNLYSNANAGISFIPITGYFDKQPPSKTYEYLSAGIPVIATNTSENRRIINDSNGVLITDTPEDFEAALLQLWEKRDHWNSDTIKSTVSEYSWENIVSNNLKQLL
jgi:glycosyltransferase involved in cell wall biosynthesis